MILSLRLERLELPKMKKYVFLRVVDRFRGTKFLSLGRPKFKIKNWATLKVTIGGKEMIEFRSQIRSTFF